MVVFASFMDPWPPRAVGTDVDWRDEATTRQSEFQRRMRGVWEGWSVAKLGCTNRRFPPSLRKVGPSNTGL
jgi:hypothetical protein